MKDYGVADPKKELKRKFLADIAEKIADETEKERRSRGGGVEMDSSEVFRIYSNDSKAAEADNKLIRLLEKKDKTKEEEMRLAQLLKVKGIPANPNILGLSDPNVTGGVGTFRVSSIDEIKRLDMSHELMFPLKEGIRKKKGGIR
ncbi:MAG: hypothetical protein V1875_04150 [Candidatus Altiarchaeota archaeon]